MSSIPDVFAYADYRLFLRDYYRARKKDVSGFTYATIAQRAGFSSPSFIKHIIDGARNLTSESTHQLACALELNKSGERYFESLVAFNQSNKLDEKLSRLKEMDSFRPSQTLQQLNPSQYRYLDEWYIPVIREMSELPGFAATPAWISRMLIASVKPRDIIKAVAFLVDEGYLVPAANSGFVKREPIFVAPASQLEPILATIRRKYHLSMMEQARCAVSDLPIGSRDVGNTTLSFSEVGYRAAVERIDQLRRELLEIAQSDTGADRIYQFTTTLFPLTHQLSDTLEAL